MMMSCVIFLVDTAERARCLSVSGLDMWEAPSDFPILISMLETNDVFPENTGFL